MTVQALIETLLQVKNKQQMVSVSVDDIEPTHTEIVGILSGLLILPYSLFGAILIAKLSIPIPTVCMKSE